MIEKIAVIGATGTLGREVLTNLSEANYKSEQITAIASDDSVGKEVSFGEEAVLSCISIENFNFASVDCAIFVAAANLIDTYRAQAERAGCWIIDASHNAPAPSEIPLIFPALNKEKLQDMSEPTYLNCPRSMTGLLALSLKPFAAHQIHSLNATCLYPTSHAGKDAMDELFRQTKGIFVNDVPEQEVFHKQIAFNVIPRIGHFVDQGATDEEAGVELELQDLFGAQMTSLISCVRVPIFIGHAAMVHIVLDANLTAQEARLLWSQTDDILVYDKPEPQGHATPVEIVGEDNIYISRIRVRPHPKGTQISYWCVGDNLRLASPKTALDIITELHHLDI